jgi:hypothetical protein
LCRGPPGKQHEDTTNQENKLNIAACTFHRYLPLIS